jgi:hypothetical protein
MAKSGSRRTWPAKNGYPPKFSSEPSPVSTTFCRGVVGQRCLLITISPVVDVYVV